MDEQIPADEEGVVSSTPEVPANFPPDVDDPGMEPAALTDDQRPEPEEAVVDSGEPMPLPEPPGNKEELPLGEQAGWSPPDVPPPGVETAPEGFSPPPAPAQVSEKAEPLTTECAFIVYLEGDGHWMATHLINREINMAREANVNDFFHAAATITRDISSSDTASKQLLLQRQAAQQIMEQQQTAAIAAQMGGPIGQGLDLSKMRGR